MQYLKDDARVRTAQLSPPLRYHDLPEEEGAPSALGLWYNRVGGLLDHLAERQSFDPSLALVLWYLDRGDPASLSSRLDLRVEFASLFKHWGSEHVAIFDRHFRFGSRNGHPGATWQNQEWRPDEDSEWRALHVGAQQREYEAFAFIEELAGKEVACLSSRLTSLRLDGADFASHGYESAVALFSAMRSSERWQVCAFFEQLLATEVVGDLSKEDWMAMAKKRAELERPPSFLRRFLEVRSAAAELRTLPTAPLDPRQVEAEEEVFSIDLNQVQRLRLFNSPEPAPVLAILGEGDPIHKRRTHAERPDWWYVEATLDTTPVKGWVNSAYLKAGAAHQEAWPRRGRIPASHLGRQGQTRDMAEGRCYPLNDGGMPTRDGSQPAERRAQLSRIADYLDPSDKEHLRYLTADGESHAGTFVHDFCILARVYVPRVWWRDPALLAFGAGAMPHVVNGSTVAELSTNGLFDWLRDFGPENAWRRHFHIGELQRAANQGQVALIVAQSRNPDSTGHASVVVPEREGVQAFRKDNKVLRPVESQVGQPLGPSKTRWWLDQHFIDFAFWVHD